jgi:diguanylate cyclase (GGDEF)-like protein
LNVQATPPASPATPGALGTSTLQISKPVQAAGIDSDAFRSALLESRQRWRDMVALSADLVFETDVWGRLTFVFPDPTLGWPANTLLGQPSELLLADAGGATGFNPFRPTSAIRRRRAWLRRPDGESVCLSFSVVPLLDCEGRIAGSRGVAQDVTEEDGTDTAVAVALRRGEVVDHILNSIRKEVLAPRMMQAGLEALTIAIGAEGCMLLDLFDGVAEPVLRNQVGSVPDQVLHCAIRQLRPGGLDAAFTNAPDGRSVLVCPSQTRFGDRAGLAMWRQPGARRWDDDDLVLVTSATGIVRVILEQDSVQREMVRQARTDPLTGLLNRRAFLSEVGRRIERLEREGLPGTVMFVDLDNFKALNDHLGHERGDEALCIVANLLRVTFRPSDLVARLGGDEFAVWLDGSDEFTAGERAEALRIEAPKLLAEVSAGSDASLSMSIGIATRWPNHPEGIDQLMLRADQAMYEVKRSGRGNWRVSQVRRL